MTVGGGEQRRERNERTRERGATIVMVAFMLIALTAIAATVVDLAAARADRATNQIAADTAATAAANVLSDGGGNDACLAALGYLEEATGETISGLSCGSFPQDCTASTASVVATGTSGSMTFELVHPVPNTSALMSPGAIGATSQPIVSADGDPCDRFGVRIQEIHSAVFGHVVGTDQLTTSIHAVAMNGAGPDEGRIVNLLLLEREDCEVLSVSGGGGGKGGIIVGSFVDDETGEVHPGRISVDSDGSGSCQLQGGHQYQRQQRHGSSRRRAGMRRRATRRPGRRMWPDRDRGGRVRGVRVSGMYEYRRGRPEPDHLVDPADQGRHRLGLQLQVVVPLRSRHPGLLRGRLPPRLHRRPGHQRRFLGPAHRLQQLLRRRLSLHHQEQ